MMPFEDAYRNILQCARPLGSEPADIEHACGRVLAADVVSDVDMPPFRKAAMDGYACRRADLGRPWTVLETIAAGQVPEHAVGPGACAKIMTGAMVPAGADCVVMVEHTARDADGTVRFTGRDTRDNICLQGEDVRTGDVVVPKGTRLRPQHVPLLAAAGCVRPEVACRPRVGVVATGSELVPPSAKPSPGRIRDTNSVQLAAQVAAAGGVPSRCGMAGDTAEALDAAFRAAAAANDVLVFAGGISMGDFDLVPDVLERNGLAMVVRKVAVKPGRPTLFARSDAVCCFGLPGNPVSAFVTFELFVRPFLAAMMGADPRVPRMAVPLARRFTRRKTDREAWIPVALDADGAAVPVEYHGPAHAGALGRADGLIAVPVGVAEIPEGARVLVRPL